MTFDTLLGVIVARLVLGYLLTVLARPEQFQVMDIAGDIAGWSRITALPGLFALFERPVGM